MTVERPYRDTHVSVARLRKVPRDYSKSPLCEGKKSDGPFYYKEGEYIGKCKKCGLPAAFIPIYKGSSNLKCTSCDALYLCTGSAQGEKQMDPENSVTEHVVSVIARAANPNIDTEEAVRLSHVAVNLAQAHMTMTSVATLTPPMDYKETRE